MTVHLQDIALYTHEKLYDFGIMLYVCVIFIRKSAYEILYFMSQTFTLGCFIGMLQSNDKGFPVTICLTLIAYLLLNQVCSSFKRLSNIFLDEHTKLMENRETK